MSEWVVLEYCEPVSPSNRKAWDFGLGPCVFEASPDEVSQLMRRLGADSPFRIVGAEAARKMGLL